MNEQNTQPTAEQNTNRLNMTRTVYYWVDLYWTFDKEEADEADQYGIYAGKHSVLTVENVDIPQDIDDAVKAALGTDETKPDPRGLEDLATVCAWSHTVESHA